MKHRERVAASVAIVLVGSLAACGAGTSRPSRPLHSATLTSGSWNGQSWTLTLDGAHPNDAWCWTLAGAGLHSGACGFNDPHDPTTGPSDSQPLDADHALEYGPAPVGTAKVVLVAAGLPAQASATDANGQISAAQPGIASAGAPVTVGPHPLPTWAPPGLWWTAVVKSGVWLPHFYDAAGRELTPTKY